MVPTGFDLYSPYRALLEHRLPPQLGGQGFVLLEKLLRRRPERGRRRGVHLGAQGGERPAVLRQVVGVVRDVGHHPAPHLHSLLGVAVHKLNPFEKQNFETRSSLYRFQG
jgi:hypothetical protein